MNVTRLHVAAFYLHQASLQLPGLVIREHDHAIYPFIGSFFLALLGHWDKLNHED